MLANGGTWVPAATGNGGDFVPIINGFFWTTVGFMIVGFTIAAAGGIVQLAAWIGALVNTYQIADKAWFIILLAGGILGLVSACSDLPRWWPIWSPGQMACPPVEYMRQRLNVTDATMPDRPDRPAPTAPQPVWHNHPIAGADEVAARRKRCPAYSGDHGDFIQCGFCVYATAERNRLTSVSGAWPMCATVQNLIAS